MLQIRIDLWVDTEFKKNIAIYKWQFKQSFNKKAPTVFYGSNKFRKRLERKVKKLCTNV